MRRKLTITVSDEVYRGLHQTVGRGEISRFIESLVRPHVVSNAEILADYQAMAADQEREQEALEWIEASPDDALDDLDEAPHAAR